MQLDRSAFSGVTTHDGSRADASYVRRADASARLRVNPQWRAAATVAHEDDTLLLDTAAVSWLPRDGLELRVGRIDPGFGLDNANSSSWTAGIERSAIWDLTPGIADSTKGFGVRADGHGRAWHASAGLYDKRDRKSLVARGVWMQTKAGEQVLQLGASIARSGSMDDNGRVRTRLGLRGVSEDPAGRRSDLAPGVRPPGRYSGETVLGLEVAAQRGPWLLQAEALTRRLEGEAGAPSRSVSGQTVQVAWSPSGESRRYDARDADPRAAGHGVTAGFRVSRLDPAPSGNSHCPWPAGNLAICHSARGTWRSRTLSSVHLSPSGMWTCTTRRDVTSLSNSGFGQRSLGRWGERSATPTTGASRLRRRRDFPIELQRHFSCHQAAAGDCAQSRS